MSFGLGVGRSATGFIDICRFGASIICGCTSEFESQVRRDVFMSAMASRFSFQSSAVRSMVTYSLQILRARHEMPPNKSPEPTAVGAVRSAIAVHVVGRRWLSFLR